MTDAAPTRLATILTRHRIVVRFGDCDLLGHVNNAKYLTYIESARIDLWRAQLGFLRSHVIDERGKRGHGFILARAEVDFPRAEPLWRHARGQARSSAPSAAAA
jgi:acyl-CoA thioesterase FadM